MMSAWNKILLEYQNSDKVLVRKQNCKQNFDFETRVGVDNDVCMKDYSGILSNFVPKRKFCVWKCTVLIIFLQNSWVQFVRILALLSVWPSVFCTSSPVDTTRWFSLFLSCLPTPYSVPWSFGRWEFLLSVVLPPSAIFFSFSFELASFAFIRFW